MHTLSVSVSPSLACNIVAVSLSKKERDIRREGFSSSTHLESSRNNGAEQRLPRSPHLSLLLKLVGSRPPMCTLYTGKAMKPTPTDINNWISRSPIINACHKR